MSEKDASTGGSDRALLEELAALEHRQWMHWTENLVAREDLPDHLIERWEPNWIDYENLPEETKEHDRKWAKQVIEILDRDVYNTGNDLSTTESDQS